MNNQILTIVGAIASSFPCVAHWVGLILRSIYIVRLLLPIIVSGGGQENSSFTEAGLMAEVLRNNFHVPVLAIEDKSKNTADESQFLATIFRQYGIHTIYLVANAWHMSRSVYSFKNAGMMVIPAPMGYVMLQSEQPLLNYLPSYESLEASNFALHEYIGLIWYRLHYRTNSI